MPQSDPEIDLKLRNFLVETEAERRQGHTLANIRAELFELARTVKGINARVAALESDRDEVHDRLDAFGAQTVENSREIVLIKRRLRRDDDDEEMQSGTYDYEEIKRELALTRKRRAESERAKAEEATWWKRSIITWLVGGLGAVATILLTILLTLAIAGASATKK